MQSIGLASWNRKADYFRSIICSSIVPLPILIIMIIGISPALKSEAFATGTAGQVPQGRATAVASAQIVKPFTMDSGAQAGNDADSSAITGLRRTTIRSCASILGKDSNQVARASCELRLIEMQ